MCGEHRKRVLRFALDFSFARQTTWKKKTTPQARKRRRRGPEGPENETRGGGAVPVIQLKKGFPIFFLMQLLDNAKWRMDQEQRCMIQIKKIHSYNNYNRPREDSSLHIPCSSSMCCPGRADSSQRRRLILMATGSLPLSN